MNPTDYVKGVLRTECPYGPALERLEKYPLLLLSLAQNLGFGIRVGRDQDLTKKAVFYGKGPLFDAAVVSEASHSESCQEALARIQSDPRLIRLVHAYIGMMTEAGELQEQIYGVLFEGKELDVVNCQEEGGDGLWYHGVHSDTIGMSLEDMMAQNNAKLRARFPEKFTAEEADIRKLDVERRVLEGIPCLTKAHISAGTLNAEQKVLDEVQCITKARVSAGTLDVHPYSTAQVENQD